MKVSATNGSMVLDYLDGRVSTIGFVSEDLSYDYEPPADLPYQQNRVYQHLKERHPEDFEFQIDVVLIQCDADTCDSLLNSAFRGVRDSTKASLHPRLSKYYEEWDRKARKTRNENPFSDFMLPNEPGRELYTISVKRQGKDQWLALSYDSAQAWEVTFYASQYGPLYGYISEEARKAGVKPYEVEIRDDFNARDYEVEGLRGAVEVAVETHDKMAADLEYTMNFKRDVDEIPFVLISFRGFGGNSMPGRSTSMVINSLQDGEGRDLTWIMTGPAKGYVVFPEQIKAGSKQTLHIEFESRGSIIKFNPSFSYMDRSGWLPFLRFTDRIDDFELTVTAPSKYTVLGIGTKMSEEQKGEVTTTHWKAFNPVAFPTIIFGDYYSATAKIKATKMDGTEIPVTVYADKDGMADRGIRGKQLIPVAEQAINSLNLYREIYGVDYPYGKLDLVNDPVGVIGPLYGQAPSSLIFLGWMNFRGEGLLGSYTGEGDLTKTLRSLTSHEVGHQWWGHTISHANNRTYWFIETFTEYVSGLYVEAVNSDGGKNPDKGWKAYLDKVGQWRDVVLNVDMVTSVQDSSALYSGEDGFGGYVAAVYNKGPYALHVLRMTFGMDKMNEFLRTLMHEFKDREIVARDIEAIAERVYGGDMSWFFDQWIRGIGIPEYSFKYDTRRTEDGNWLVQGTVRQHVVFGKKKEELEGVYFRGVVPITVLGVDRQEYPVRLIVEGEETPFAFKLPVKPLEVDLNKYGEILAHDVLENRSW
jgi:hypothetical protein